MYIEIFCLVLAFEHKGWQSKQCEFFADVFTDAIENGLPAIQTQHPGLYYQQAAQHAVARRETADEQGGAEEGSSYPDPDPLQGAEDLEFFGQRPWRPGKVSLEPPDMEQVRIVSQQALQFNISLLCFFLTANFRKAPASRPCSITSATVSTTAPASSDSFSGPSRSSGTSGLRGASLTSPSAWRRSSRPPRSTGSTADDKRTSKIGKIRSEISTIS